jgi:pimeloyl-ACP methyl ester carboxylesterase
MATFVLVHGAWHGGWCWAPTEQRLQALGHRVFSPTLTGQGDRSHLLSADITPDTHVRDIVNFIRWRDLKDVILVGHSYGGMVITGVAAQIPEALHAMIYLDAFVPEESGVSIFATANPVRMAAFQKQIDAGAEAVAADMFDVWTDKPETRALLVEKCTDQPVGTLLNGVTLTGREAGVAHKHFIICTQNSPSAFWPHYEKVQGRAGWSHDQIDARHNAMVDEAEALTAQLHAYVTQLPQRTSP